MDPCGVKQNRLIDCLFGKSLGQGICCVLKKFKTFDVGNIMIM